MKALGEFKSKIQAPKNFRPAVGVQWAELCSQPSFIRATKQTGVRADGLRYEKKVHSYLEGRFGKSFVKSPWLHFLANGKEEYCQPDGILLLTGQTVIVECKLSHTALAWWQLKHLYLPVLEKLLGTSKPFKLLEICKWFDPHTKFPERFEFTESPDCIAPAPFQVHVWKGR